MWRWAVIVVAILLSGVDLARGQAVRGAFPSPSIQILPMMVAAEITQDMLGARQSGLSRATGCQKICAGRENFQL